MIDQRVDRRAELEDAVDRHLVPPGDLGVEQPFEPLMQPGELELRERPLTFEIAQVFAKFLAKRQASHRVRIFVEVIDHQQMRRALCAQPDFRG